MIHEISSERYDEILRLYMTRRGVLSIMRLAVECEIFPNTGLFTFETTR